MGYLLIWVEFFTIAVLLTMLVVSLLSRLKSHAVRLVVGLVIIAAPIAFAVTVFRLRHWFYYYYDYTISLAICEAIAISIVVALGLRPTGGPGAVRARSWPLGRIATALLIALGLHILSMWNMDAAARSVVASLRAEASSVALSVAPAKPGDHENAALVYYKAFESLKVPKELASLGDWDAQFDENIDLFRKALETKRVTLDLVSRGAAMPQCRFDRDYARPSLSMLIPEVQHLRDAAGLLALRARLRGVDGQVASALEDVSAIFGLSRHAGTDGLLVTHLVAAAIHDLGCKAFVQVLSASSPSLEDFQKLQMDDVQSFEAQLHRTLLMEEAFGVSAFGELPHILPDPHAYQMLASPLGAYVRVFFLTADLEKYMSGMRQTRNLLRQPSEQQATQLKYFSEQRGFLLDMLLPSLEGVLRATHKTDAMQAIALATAAAARYRAEHSRLPTSIVELEGKYVQVPLLDPYNGKPIHFKSTDDALIIYSVGPDRVDDGGSDFSEETQTGDISMTLRSKTQPSGGSDFP